MNRIQAKLQEDKKLLSIYFTAGYPNLNDTVTTIENLEQNGRCRTLKLQSIRQSSPLR